MFETIREPKITHARVPEDVQGREQPAGDAEAQPRTPLLKTETAGSVPTVPQSALPSPQEKLKQHMATQQASDVAPPPRQSDGVANAEDQRLVVGPRIRLRGDLTNCDTLVIEGYFEGSATSRMIQITEGGTFVGDVQVETAEITGSFDGTLTASNRLIVRSTGRVTGTIRYSAVEIEPGGQISGDVQITEEGNAGSVAPDSLNGSERPEEVELASWGRWSGGAA